MQRHWQSAAPARDALDLDQVKLHLRVDQEEDDDLITDLIRAATTLAEQYTGRALISQSWTLTTDRAVWPLELPRWPVSAVTSLIIDGVQYVTTVDEALVLDSTYTLYSGDDAFIDGGSGGETLTVIYTAGYGRNYLAIPTALRQWMLLQIGQWYEHREATVIQAGAPHALPFVDALLTPYRINLLGV